MMQIFLLIVWLSLWLHACQGAKLQQAAVRSGSTGEAKQEAQPYVGEESEPNPTASTTQQQSEAGDDSVLAATPVMVGGAFLTCRVIPNTRDAECLARDRSGSPAMIDAMAAFILQGSPATWTAASFRSSASLGQFFVSIPNGLNSDFGIAILYNQDQVMLDWLVGSDPSLFNLVGDGSFESLPIAAGASFAQMPSSSSPLWKARTTASSNCSTDIGYIEVQNTRVPNTIPAAHGSQWLELDAVCSDTTLTNAGNMAVYQDLKTQLGHIYILRFSYTRRNGDTAPEFLRASVNGLAFLATAVTENAWQSSVHIFIADSPQSRIEFEEMGQANRLGTLLDNVQVFDLGSNLQFLPPKNPR